MLSLIYLDGGRMEKIIKKHLTVSSDSRYTEKLWNEIYSKDKGTAVFKFTVDELTAQKVIFLFYFKNTKRYITINASIEGNTITVPFDSSLIVESEPVIGYVYFEKVEQSMDVYSFTFNVKVSAIDKAQETPLIERKSGRVVDVESIVTKQELDELFNKIKVQGGAYDDSNLRAELENKADRTEIAQITGKIEVLEQKTDKGTIYDDRALKQRVSALESKPEVDTSGLVTKQELASKGYLTEHQPLTEYAKKSELPQAYNDTDLKQRVSRLESNPSIDTSSLVTKQELESKHYLTEHQPLTEYAKKSELPQPYNDTELKERVTRLESKSEVDTSGLVTKQELENKNYLTSHQDISRLATKEELNNLVTKQELRDKNYLTSHQSLSDYALKSEIPTPYNDLELKKRVESLESKPNLDTSNFVTNEVLNSKGYLTQHQSLEGYAKKTELAQPYNDAELKERVARLESKPEADTSGLVTKQELASKGYLTEHQSLTEYAKKSELPQSYNDTDLKQRVSRLESKKEIDTSSFVTKQELNGKGYLTQHQSLTGYAKKTELPQPYNDSALKQRLTALESKQSQNIINQNGGQPLKYWAGTKAQYDAISKKDASTIYDIYTA